MIIDCNENPYEGTYCWFDVPVYESCFVHSFEGGHQLDSNFECCFIAELPANLLPSPVLQRFCEQSYDEITEI